MTPSTTWGDKFMVPADAEVIIEGEILPGVRKEQNPFGEILGYAQPKMDVPVIEVTAITHRRGGIVEDFWPGHMDHWNLGSVPKEGSTYNVIKKNVPGIKAIHLAASGCGRCICYISIKKEFENEPNKAGMQAFVEMPNFKLAVIVDDDIDVFNEREVMWAVATRVHWDKDIEIIREVQSFRGWLGDTVAIIDATIPFKSKSEWPVRNEVEPAPSSASRSSLNKTREEMEYWSDGVVGSRPSLHYSTTPEIYPWPTSLNLSTKPPEPPAVKQEVSCNRRKSISKKENTAKTPFTEKELREIIGDSPIEPFLNTRTPLYREKNMKQKPPSKDEAIKLMLKDPNLLKRPVIIKGKKKLTGFNEAEVKELL